MQSQCSSAAVSTPSSPAQSDDSNSSGSSSSSGGNSSNSSISTSDAPDDCNSVARSRWKILAQALQKTGPVTTIPTSVRRFQSYGLVTALPLENLHENSATWCEYSANIGQEMFSVLVRHPKRSFTASDLMGFNNTGNICVWPSEEVLAYYGLCNREMFCGKSVLEVGGGMSCLAGLMIGKYTDAARVHLTDGNASSMDNVQRILEKNGFGASSHVTSSVLQWGKRSKVCNRSVSVPSEGVHRGFNVFQFDVILSADCLFFDEVRHDLVQTMWDFMVDGGLALVTAPRRAETLDKFCEEACSVGFSCSLQEFYNEHLWDRHLQLKTSPNNSYDEDIHYPLLLKLQKGAAENIIQ